MFKLRQIREGQRRTKGTVCIEFAFVAPIFFMIVIASVEFARVHMVQCAVENACFEGARRGILPGATSAACKTKTVELLEMAGVSESEVVIEPAEIDASTTEIAVTAKVPLNAKNGFGISGFFKGQSMMKKIGLPCQVR